MEESLAVNGKVLLHSHLVTRPLVCLQVTKRMLGHFFIPRYNFLSTHDCITIVVILRNFIPQWMISTGNKIPYRFHDTRIHQRNDFFVIFLDGIVNIVRCVNVSYKFHFSSLRRVWCRFPDYCYCNYYYYTTFSHNLQVLAVLSIFSFIYQFIPLSIFFFFFQYNICSSFSIYISCI